MKSTKRIALAGMLCALAAVVMSLGGFIPLATFCCPALAGLALVPIFVECGEKFSWGAWVAISALGLMLCPDKEAALLFCFIGYYPILRWRLEQLRKTPLRIAAKLGVFNGAVLLMYAMSIFLFKMDYLMEEYREMGLLLTLVTLLLGNITLLLYDRMLAIATIVYVKRFRGRLM